MEKIITILGLIFILGIFTLFGIAIYQYASYGAKVGTVVDKEYSSERDYYTTQTQHIGNDTIRIPQYHHEPAKWKLKLQKTEDDKTKEIWIEVTEQEYDSIKIGEFYGE